jgi:PAS domain S-box-containing protein
MGKKTKSQSQLTASTELTGDMVLNDLAYQTGSIIFEYDIATDRSRWFGNAEEVLGYTTSQLAPMGKEAWEELIHPDDRERAATEVRETLAHGYRLLHEYRFRHAGGRYMYLEESATITRNADGTPERALVMIRDITSRWEALSALAESERRFRATFEYAAIGIHHVAPDGHYLRINPRFCEIVGYSEKELRSLNFQDITHPDDLAADLEYVGCSPESRRFILWKSDTSAKTAPRCG